jgi:uroporphyrinogen-III decarboxylase
VRPLYPDKYIDYVVTSNVKLDHWCREEMYEKYAIELIRKEGVETALERSINTMVKWAKEKDSVYNHYFSYASTNRITWDIKDGKISPWLVLNCKTGKTALNNFNDEQLGMLGAVLDPSHWALRFKRQPSDVELVKQVVKEANL